MIKYLIKQVLYKLCYPLLRSIQIHNKKKTLPIKFLNHLKKIKNSDTVIDLGANTGLVTEILAKTKANVIAIEPNSIAFKQLDKLSKKYKNIKIINKAAGIKNTRSKLYLHKNTNNSGNHTQASSLLKNKPNVSENIFEDIYEIDFAEYIISLGRKIEILKIDIEGYEVNLINHLIDTNAIKIINNIYVETHEEKFKDLEIDTLKLKSRINDLKLGHKFTYGW